VSSSSFLTPTVDEAQVAVRRWITLQAEPLGSAVARGEPAAVEVLRFAEMETAVPSGRLDRGTARLAVAKDHIEEDDIIALLEPLTPLA
jgi:hypothetical protein